MKAQILLTLLLAHVFQGTLSADDWPQWRGPTRDGVWRESGIVEQFDGPEIKLRWSTPISGGYSGPTVADRRVYVTDRVTEPDEMERVHCFRWTDGTKIWSHAYPCDYSKINYRTGPRASVTIDDGRAYSLGSVGHFFCLDAATGKVLWKKDPVDDFRARVPTWGIASHPLVEGDLLILQIGGEDGACIVALDKKTGRRRWAALDDKPSYSAPIVIDQAGRRVLVCWTGTRVVGLDAATGEIHWQHEVGFARWVIGIASPVWHKDRVLITAVDKGSLMLRLHDDGPHDDGPHDDGPHDDGPHDDGPHDDGPAAEKLWWRRGTAERRTDGLHALMCTPYLDGDHVYGVNGYGLMRCLDAATGERIWEDATAASQVRWGTLHMVRNGKNIWMFNDRGELIISRLSPRGFEEISRAKLIEPTRGQLPKGDGVTWSHPAFAYKHVFVRNDEELVCAGLAAEQ